MFNQIRGHIRLEVSPQQLGKCKFPDRDSKANKSDAGVKKGSRGSHQHLPTHLTFTLA
ncbi:hypothetical protein HBH92_063780 [Parastagonospora nodorum]|nr:hypothetical protein HBH42_072680 [Parastagonospora nodorum]KAH4417197.1 hypothetical protein HBH92_063780 [Parastagonospora nodorum]KAH4424347.1 hypothetical protein HBH93_188590 [Parastagonospora nodorum]KAH4457965.1 hypothetical protein HBH91_083880 [Parastagonospora nodorum]KAH4511455.1 hypothetical protein HBH89_043120 [Parastagonospora nodorum]